MKKNRARREFLAIVGTAALIFVTPFYFTPKSEKIKDDEEYVFINGWLLKKGDLNDI